MRILELILRPGVGGAETLVGELTRTFITTGHTVDVVAIDDAPDPADRIAFERRVGRTVPSLAPRLRGIRPHQLARALATSRWLRNHRYDVVHAHTFIPNVYARLGALLANEATPIVTTLHSAGRDFAATRDFVTERILAPRADAVVAVSDSLATEYRTMFPRMASRICVIPNGIASPAGPRRDIGVTPRVFLAVSRLVKLKGIDVLLRGFAAYQRTHNDARLLIAGPDTDIQYASSVRTLARELRLDQSVVFLGPRGDVGALLRDCDVFVHAALAESQGLAVLEAAMAAVPIVCSDLPVLRSALSDHALYFAPGNPEELAASFNLLATQWSDRIAMAVPLASTVSSRFGIERCAAAYGRVFDCVIRGDDPSTI